MVCVVEGLNCLKSSLPEPPLPPLHRLVDITYRALELDAYKLAIDTLKKGIDTDLYKRVSRCAPDRLTDRDALSLSFCYYHVRGRIDDRCAWS
jgi:hypothetical protein